MAEVDREGFQEPLLFPPFHQEILQASSWDAGQLLGRVRIVVTEGFSRETNPPHNNLKHSFVRIRDILAFSFQHAPTRKLRPTLAKVQLMMVMVIDILEFSGIAWPNPGMWAHAQSRNVQGPVSSAPRALVADTKEDGDAHAHSPRRPSHEDVCSSGGISNKRYLDHEDHWAHQSMAPPSNRLDATGWNQSQQRESNMIRQNGPLADPFLEPCAPSTATVRRGTKKSSEDTPMPDASSYESSRNITGMTGLGYEQKGMPLHNIASHEAIMNQLVEALSPLKSDDDGPHNTTNTPSSGRVFSRPSAAAQARATTRRVTGPARGSPGTDRNERHTVDTSVVDSTKIISSHPVGSVQSKKEGEDNKENTPDHRVAGADYTGCSSLGHNVIYMKSSERLAGSSDSKRKRPLEEVPDPVCRSSINNSMSPSPSKKMSKGASAECLAKGRSPHTPGEGRELNGGVSLKAAAGA